MLNTLELSFGGIGSQVRVHNRSKISSDTASRRPVGVHLPESMRTTTSVLVYVLLRVQQVGKRTGNKKGYVHWITRKGRDKVLDYEPPQEAGQYVLSILEAKPRTVLRKDIEREGFSLKQFIRNHDLRNVTDMRFTVIAANAGEVEARPRRHQREERGRANLVTITDLDEDFGKLKSVRPKSRKRPSRLTKQEKKDHTTSSDQTSSELIQYTQRDSRSVSTEDTSSADAFCSVGNQFERAFIEFSEGHAISDPSLRDDPAVQMWEQLISATGSESRSLRS